MRSSSGVVTTPCLAHAAASGDFAAGIMVSASHNPADDNGLKVLSGGRKIDDEVEEELERLLFQAESLPGRPNAEIGRITHDDAGRSTPTARARWREAGDALRGHADRDRLRERLGLGRSRRTCCASSAPA